MANGIYTESDSQLAFYGIQKQREKLEQEKADAAERRAKIANITVNAAKMTSQEWNTKTKELMNMDVDQPLMDQRKTIIDKTGKEIANPNFQQQAVNPITNEPMTKTVKMYEADPDYVKKNVLERWITPPGGRVQQTAEAEKYQGIIDDYATRGEVVPEDLVPETAWDAIDAEGSESLIFGDDSMAKNVLKQSRLGGGQGYIKPGAPDRPDIPVEMETEFFDDEIVIDNAGDFPTFGDFDSPPPVQGSAASTQQGFSQSIVTDRELRRDPIEFGMPEKIGVEEPTAGSMDTAKSVAITSAIPSAMDELSVFAGDESKSIESAKFIKDQVSGMERGTYLDFEGMDNVFYDVGGEYGLYENAMGKDALSFNEYSAKNILNYEAMAKEAGVLDDAGRAVSSVEVGVDSAGRAITAGGDMADAGADLAGALDLQKADLVADIGVEAAEELGVEAAGEAAGTVGSKAGTVLGAAGAVYGGVKLYQDWDDMSGVDKTLGTTSTALSAASAVPGPHQPFTLVGSLAVSLLDYFWD